MRVWSKGKRNIEVGKKTVKGNPDLKIDYIYKLYKTCISGFSRTT